MAKSFKTVNGKRKVATLIEEKAEVKRIKKTVSKP